MVKEDVAHLGSMKINAGYEKSGHLSVVKVFWDGSEERQECFKETDAI
jgi:hypothetical protein